MHFKNNTFDYIICNHVLEHILDEVKAISEIYRTLKKGGKAILSFPIDLSLDKTLEDEKINTPLLRLQYYGIENHVRLYGRDCIERISKFGFKIEEHIVKNEFNKNDIETYSLLEEDRVFICTKI